jgi:hypothetical protein
LVDVVNCTVEGTVKLRVSPCWKKPEERAGLKVRVAAAPTVVGEVETCTVWKPNWALAGVTKGVI